MFTLSEESFYTVSAWYRKGNGGIGGAHCQCVAGLSKTCHAISTAMCTDLPCAWIMPPRGKRVISPTPLEDISFRKYLVNKPPRESRKRVYKPCKDTTEKSQAFRDLVENMAECCANMF
ncbi:uncharacterized protein LOC135387141 [Ornithodoros turicata]|uniref:uncharacterized protein LOC135387141 n=1 Tax=Ornithodoros turicata TaxID=34597 RepID=UPI00313A07AF